VGVNRLTETLACDSHTHVRRKNLRAAQGRNLAAAQSIRGRWRRLAFAAGPESAEDGAEAGFEVLGGVTLAEFIGSLDDLGRRLIADRNGDEPFANTNIGGARDFPEHRSEREHQQGVEGVHGLSAGEPALGERGKHSSVEAGDADDRGGPQHTKYGDAGVVEEKLPQMPEQVGHLLVPGAAGVEIPKTRSDNSVNCPVEQVVFVSDVAIDPHGAEAARLGDTPDGHRVDAVSVDDVDGGGDHVISRDLASFAARGLLNRRHAYNVAY
jgi:hypothetical protein